jgi:hypothetical protein
LFLEKFIIVSTLYFLFITRSLHLKMNTPTSARVRRSVALKSYRESPIDDSPVLKSVKKSDKEKSESPDENNSMNTPQKKPVGRPPKAESPEVVKENAKLKATPKSRRKRDATSEIFSPKKLRTARTPSAQALESIVLENSPTLERLESPAGSRPQRARKSTQRYSDINLTINLKQNTVKRIKEARAEDEASSVITIDDSDQENNELIAKPTTLFDDADDVEGHKLYSFKTPKKKDSMAQLAQNTPKTPHRGTPKTPRNNRLSQIQKTPTSRPLAAEFAKTPRHVRAAIKKSNSKFQTFTFQV